jgi:hypothetical protein
VQSAPTPGAKCEREKEEKMKGPEHADHAAGDRASAYVGACWEACRWRERSER